MSDKYKLLVDDIYYYVSTPNILKNYSMEKAIEAVRKNAPLVLNFLKAQKWTYCFVPFRIPSEDDEALIDRMYYSVDFEKKEIYLNMYVLAPVDLVEHYVVYASLFVFEQCMGYSIVDSTLFRAAMAMDIKNFIEIMEDIVEKQIQSFEENDVHEEAFFDILKFEYFSTHKYLYASYAKLCLETEEMKNKCVYSSNYLEGVFW